MRDDQRVHIVTSYAEATYWHNHADLARLAQNMREQMEQQMMEFQRLSLSD